jgi:serine protease Do
MNLLRNTLRMSIAVLAVTFLTAPVFAEEMNSNGIETLRKTGKAFSAVAKQATPAVVAVQVRTRVRVPQSDFFGSPFDEDFFERFFGRPMPRQRQRQPREQWQQGQASGFIISKDGYVLTNAHVIDGADEIKITMSDGREFNDIKVVGRDEQSDVALLKIQDAENLPTVELGDSDALEIGEWVIAIGNPFGLTETLTVGVVSALGRKIGGQDVYQDYIQTDAAINPGNSGGPLLNLEGKVVGINSAIITGVDRGYMGIGLAIPINMAKSIEEQLVKTGTVQRGYAGISMQPLTADMAEFFKMDNTNGAIVTSVAEDSPADKAGLKKDDVIIRIDNKMISDTQDVKNIIGFTAPGTEVEITIMRDGREKKVVMTVGSQDESELAATSDIGQKLGLTVQTVDEETADQYGVKEGQGVVITDVESGSPAEYVRLRSGMVILEVNGEAVNNVGEFNQALKKTEETKKAYLFVKAGSAVYYVTLPLSD